MVRPVVHVLRAGLTSYAQGLNLQKQIASKFHDATPEQFRNVLILTQHQPVYTIGIRTKDYTVNDEQHLRQLGADFHRTNRGGLITFHGPGQLIAYPILNLKQFTPSVRWYVCHLEKTIISVCAELGLTAGTTPDTGVWIENRKICAIGIHGKRYITTHGLALNCDNDLTWFEHIVPCGLIGKGVTSLSMEMNRPFTVAQTIPLLIDHFGKTFDCNLVECTEDETRDYLHENCKQ